MPLRIVAALLVVLACRVVRAEIAAQRVDGDGRAEWAMIQVTVSPQGEPGEISVQDVRGGMKIVRALERQATRTWLPLPLVAPDQLAGSAWPIEVELRSGGRVLEH